MMQHDATKSEGVYHPHTDDRASVDKAEKVYITTVSSTITKEELDMQDAHHQKKKKRFLCWFLTKKQWIAAIIGAVLAVIGVALLIMFLAVVPALFQHYADQVKLTINYMDIKSLSMDPNVNVVDVEISVRVAFDASASASIDDATTTLYYGNKPFGQVTLPAQSFTDANKSFDLVIRDSAEISDPEVFRALSTALVKDAQVSIDTRAKVRASAMGLSHSGLTLNREFTIKAFHQFADPKLEVNQIALSECDANGYKMLVNITLDNDSLVGIGGVGALNLSVHYQQDYLGQAVSLDPSIGLPRGPTTMVLALTIVKSPKVMAALLGMVSGLLGGKAQFYVTGNHPYAVQTALLDKAFAALNISMLYTDGMSKVKINPQCDLMSILTGGR